MQRKGDMNFVKATGNLLFFFAVIACIIATLFGLQFVFSLIMPSVYAKILACFVFLYYFGLYIFKYDSN